MTNAEARFNKSLRPRKPEGSLGRTAQDVHLHSLTAPELLIFRHRSIIIYTRLPAGGTSYPTCTFPASSECLIGISDAFSAFCLRVSVILPTCSLYPQQKRAYSALHPQAWTYIYRSMPGGSYRVQSPGFPKIVYCQHAAELSFSQSSPRMEGGVTGPHPKPSSAG